VCGGGPVLQLQVKHFHIMVALACLCMCMQAATASHLLLHLLGWQSGTCSDLWQWLKYI
jgi:hypothetical protein